MPPGSGHSTPSPAPRLLFSPSNVVEGRRPEQLTPPWPARPREARILLDHRPAAADCARMAGADRFKLRFGPYRTPRFCHGGALRCEPRTLGAVSARRRGWAAASLPRTASTLLAGQGLPAPSGQGYTAGVGLGSHSWLVGPSIPYRLVAGGPTIEAADGRSVRPPPVDWRQPDQPTIGPAVSRRAFPVLPPSGGL